ncbi:putative hotdog family 3-hydroxylacyl-ACP dehydratase [Luteibacter sp. Sphag1AF]|uniref:phosphotransferase n=1 Tax=Luteibacter sp. Sphag1AF TaxID=2587031 RepID=UPI001616B200|nr:phosphotransferase [Luteibacter sp. Sphag1AF]MBB3226369.1 putative hotdog family 3-hydroxylacyl-ACP dehydratase [Luteibacter sp. Sphag1AF]
MLDKTDWIDLIPHAADMCLVDTVLSWDERVIHGQSTNHTSPTHPLRGSGGLHAVHLAEYGAQATAVHGALRARAAGEGAARPGMLVSLRGVELTVEYVDALTGPLDIHAECLYADTSGAQYTFRIEHAGVLLASGRAAVIHP